MLVKTVQPLAEVWLDILTNHMFLLELFIPICTTVNGLVYSISFESIQQYSKILIRPRIP